MLSAGGGLSEPAVGSEDARGAAASRDGAMLPEVVPVLGTTEPGTERSSLGVAADDDDPSALMTRTAQTRPVKAARASLEKLCMVYVLRDRARRISPSYDG